MVECKGGIVYVEDVVDGVVGKIFNCEIWDIVGTGALLRRRLIQSRTSFSAIVISSSGLAAKVLIAASIPSFMCGFGFSALVNWFS